LAESCPENFENWAALVRAEITRIDAVHNEALANEFAARFYAMRGFETNSHAHLRNVRCCYVRWGR